MSLHYLVKLKMGHRALATVELLKKETPEIITHDSINPLTYIP